MESGAEVCDCDVAVVGAGLSGLVAARRVAAAGLRVRLLEAQDRPGGRACTVALADGAVDLGGQWLAPTQPRMHALAAELGVGLVPQRRDGSVIERHGRGAAGGGGGAAGRLLSLLPFWSSIELLRRGRELEAMR